MRESPLDKPRGILNVKPADQKFRLARYLPAEDLRFFVEHYWSVRWDLCGQDPYVQETLPYPCVHLVIESGASSVYGVQTGKFVRLLEEQGRVFGVKFKPGAFYPFVKVPVSCLTNATIRFSDAFGVECTALEAALLSREDDRAVLTLVEDFLRERLPKPDEQVRVINEIVDRVSAHHEITKVDEIIDQFHLTKRTVQRLFRQYVGVSPKWVIKRARLHEVAERLADGAVVDWPTLVAELGYTDQAHLIKDFKTLVGSTPAIYARRLSVR